MPEISRFFGIVIRMFFDNSEHNPPHIHAQHNDKNASISITDYEILDGGLEKKDFKLVKKWMKIHQKELLAMWEEKIYYEIVPLDKK